jgi:hypothetical protein
MTERGILFSAPMVRALLDGTKTQTRRVVKRQPWASCSIEEGHEGESPFVYSALHGAGPGCDVEESRTPCRCPYGQPGDRLWVRETFMDLQGTGVEHRDPAGQRQRYAFAADCPPGSSGDEARKDYGLKWKPSIHMPRTASRILLEIVSVHVERLQDISETDARAEGVKIEDRHTVGYCAGEFLPPSIRAYRELWENMNGADSWDANPWVWVVEFRRIGR